jgi:subtilisin family serine protease
MERTYGRPEIAIGLIDGPVFMSHPDLAEHNIREVPGKRAGACSRTTSVACVHGTFVAGMLLAKRGSVAPAICPGCTLLVRPIFAEMASSAYDPMPSATPEELAEAIIETVQAGARVLNLSAALTQPSPRGQRELEAALHFAALRGVVVVAAAGNQGTVGSTAITRHGSVIPVAACDLQGRPSTETNLGGSLGRRGLSAPSVGVTSLGTASVGTNVRSQTFGGTSVAAPFVTGAIALLWSEFPSASAERIRWALTQSGSPRRNSIVPPLLDAWAAYAALAALHGRN